MFAIMHANFLYRSLMWSDLNVHILNIFPLYWKEILKLYDATETWKEDGDGVPLIMLPKANPKRW
jgi:hypothetical protein